MTEQPSKIIGSWALELESARAEITRLTAENDGLNQSCDHLAMVADSWKAAAARVRALCDDATVASFSGWQHLAVKVSDIEHALGVPTTDEPTPGDQIRQDIERGMRQVLAASRYDPEPVIVSPAEYERRRAAASDTEPRCKSQHARYGRCELAAGHADPHVTDRDQYPSDPGYSWLSPAKPGEQP